MMPSKRDLILLAIAIGTIWAVNNTALKPIVKQKA